MDKNYVHKAKEAFFPGPVSLDKNHSNFYIRSYSYDPRDRERPTDKSDLSLSELRGHYLNPFILPNAGIYLSCFMLGVSIYILQAPISFYFINDLQVSAFQYSAYFTLIQLSRSFTAIFGIFTDCIPIFGYRRKSWIIIAWVLCIIFGLILANASEPGFATTASLMVLMTWSYLLADVSHDALIIDRARFETQDIKGSFKTGAYSIFSFGQVVGAVVGMMLYNTQQWGWGLTISQYFLLVSLLPVVIVLPSLWDVIEIQAVGFTAPSVSNLVTAVWETLQLKAVWYPMRYYFLFYVLQVPNAAWSNFLIEGFHFSDFQLGLLVVGSAVMYYAGMLVYTNFFVTSTWRSIFVFAMVVNAIFSFLQVALIMRWNLPLGIPDILLAIGDSNVIFFTGAVAQMPINIMFVALCPPGSEGVSYAVLSTLLVVASGLSSDIGTGLSFFFDVSNDTLSSGDFSGVLYLTLITSVLQMSPIFFLDWLPKTVEEQIELRDSQDRNVFGGAVLTIVWATALTFTVVMNIGLIWL